MFFQRIFPWAALLLIGCGACLAAEPGDLDWNVWERMPVFGRGRIMPLDTVARSAVDEICGRKSPELSLDGAAPSSNPKAPPPPEAEVLFPGGKARKFRASELLFSWLVEPERWQRVPLLHAEYEALRKDMLDLPITANGRRLKHVSPSQLEDAEFSNQIAEIAQKQLEAARKDKVYRLSRVEKKATDLSDAKQRFQRLSFRPAEPLGLHGRLWNKLRDLFETWQMAGPDLNRWRQMRPGDKTSEQIAAVQKAMGDLERLLQGEKLTVADMEPALLALRKSSGAMAGQFDAFHVRMAKDPPKPGQLPEGTAIWINQIAALTKRMARQATDAHLALYDHGQTLRLVPALNVAALEADRDREDDAQPWLNFETILYGSPDVLEGYPQSKIAQVREAFDAVKRVYLDRGSPDRRERFAAAMENFAAAVRELGEAIEPLRVKLPIRNKDESLIELTAYPEPGATDVEVRYNRSDPFLWAWVVSLCATICFAMTFGWLRKPMFWAGMVVLVIAQTLFIYGFVLRVRITGFVPVTNMFETVVFVALTVAALGVWFTLLPLIWPGLSLAWRWTAAPWIAEAAKSADAEDHRGEPGKLPGEPVRWGIFILRIVLIAAVAYVMLFFDYSAGEKMTVLSLFPKTGVGSSIPTANALLTWAVGLGVLAASAWFVPRAILAVVLAVGLVPHTLAKRGIAEPLEQVYARKQFVAVGAAVAFFAAMLAYFAPIFRSDVGLSMAAVVRNNFWLALHVLSITASYGAAALAWGLGNIALGYYLFGNYRDPRVALSESGSQESPPPTRADKQPVPPDKQPVPPDRKHFRRPPEACATLARFQYKAMQVAVLLLAAGTILGGLWADVSWGRFWGWDPKEVWALISLLVYMVILHGRHVRWFGDFGLTVGSVLGLTAVVWAWYGVNYLMPGGLHSYGEGTGGQIPVLGTMCLNWIYVGIAAAQYNLGIRTSVPSDARSD